ncbi:MAG: class I SAM-dependent methyltransferase [Nevskia sp.]|nr:class I SAM-dependent methyltransferase [Nevskia sp.]
MHTTAQNNARLFFETYVAVGSCLEIVDIGAQDVNGSLRPLCPAGARYTGVDLAPGKGVDLVLEDAYTLPFRDGSIDVILSSSCFEHCEMFWILFNEILRVLKPRGLFYLNVPSNGSFHRYPVDCWRFYPDSGKALVTWARRSGFDPAVLESYISYQQTDEWNDYVAVFVKDAALRHQFPHRILHRLKDFCNGFVDGQEEIINARPLPEDLMKLRFVADVLGGRVRVR